MTDVIHRLNGQIEASFILWLYKKSKTAKKAGYIEGCRGIWQLGGLVSVVSLGVPLRCEACKLGDPLSYPLDNERTLVWQ